MEEGNSINKSNLTSSMKNKSRVSKLATASSTTTGSNVPPPSTGNNPPLPRRRGGRPPRHPSSSTKATAPHHREQDQYMPIANVIRVMRQILPSTAKISDEAKETIQECISEFINYISEEANAIRKVEHRKVISADDLVAAMSKLGFGHYAEPLTTYLCRYREAEGKDDFIQALRMRLFRPIAVGPGAVMVPPPVMADPYFYPHEGVGIGGGHGEYGVANIGGCHDGYVDHGYGGPVIGGGSGEYVGHGYGSINNNSTMMNVDVEGSSNNIGGGSSGEYVDHGYGSTKNATMINVDVGNSSNNIGGGRGQYVDHGYGVADIGGDHGEYVEHGLGVGINGGRQEYVDQGYGSTIINSTMMNFDVGSSNYGSTIDNSTMMNFDCGSFCNNIGCGREEYDGHGYGVTGVGGGRGEYVGHGHGVGIGGGHAKYVGQGYGSTINPMMNFVGSSSNNIGGDRGLYDDHGYGVAGIGGGIGQYVDHGYGVGIGGGGGEFVDHGYASTINNTMMNFGVIESSSNNYNDNNVLLEYNDVFNGLLPPNSAQDVESIDEL